MSYPQAPVEDSLPEFDARSDAGPMSRVDGCPNCVLNTEPATSWVPLTNGYRTAHRCTDCGHAWTVDWRD